MYAFSQCTIVPLCTFTDQVSKLKAGRPACASEASTVSDHLKLKCGLSHGLLRLAIIENITVLGRRVSSMASNLVAHSKAHLFSRAHGLMSCLGSHRPSSCIICMVCLLHPQHTSSNTVMHTLQPLCLRLLPCPCTSFIQKCGACHCIKHLNLCLLLYISQSMWLA